MDTHRVAKGKAIAEQNRSTLADMHVYGLNTRSRSGEADGDLRDCNDGIMAQSNNGNKGIYLAW